MSDLPITSDPVEIIEDQSQMVVPHSRGRCVTVRLPDEILSVASLLGIPPHKALETMLNEQIAYLKTRAADLLLPHYSKDA